MDKYIVYEIEEKISNYEKTTGNKIQNIAIYNLENAIKFYPDINDNLNISARTEKMSAINLLKFYTNRRLNLIEYNERVYNKYFKNNDWKQFDLDQIVLENDTMYWYIY